MERRMNRHPGRVAESDRGTAALTGLLGKLFGLHELQRRGHRVDLTGRERIDGIDYCALRITLNDGYTTTLYVDPKSWLVTRRRDFRPLHVDVDPTPTTNRGPPGHRLPVSLNYF